MGPGGQKRSDDLRQQFRAAIANNLRESTDYTRSECNRLSVAYREALEQEKSEAEFNAKVDQAVRDSLGPPEWQSIGDGRRIGRPPKPNPSPPRMYEDAGNSGIVLVIVVVVGVMVMLAAVYACWSKR